ncbi:MAG: ParB/RepB/Spo0J family partition protein [Negativicutes bacterium]|jgi:ParB family chromosome partitioning protein
MAEKKRGLGKGLSALLSVSEKPEFGDTVLAVNLIHPNRYQPRRVFDDVALHELAESIKLHGVLQPVIVRSSATGYELAAGERRWRAAQLAELTEIPAIVKDYNDKEMIEIAVIENIQREDLNPMEEAAAYQRLMDECGIIQEQVSVRVGKSRSAVANLCRLLALPREVQDMVSTGEVSPGHARAILSLPTVEQQTQLAWIIAQNQLNVRQAEEQAKKIQEIPKLVEVKATRFKKSVYITDYEQRLEQQYGTKIRIVPKTLERGKIEIDFLSRDDLERILEELSKPERKATQGTAQGFVV